TTPSLSTSCWRGLDNTSPTRLKREITSVPPESEESSTVITIAGVRFGTDATKLRVRVDYTTASTVIITPSDSEIKVIAPGGFSDKAVNIQVFVSDQLLPSRYEQFYYIERFRPEITAIPATTFYHAVLVISGINFSPVAEENIVKFGDVEATVT